MVRIQKYIASNRPVKYNREIQAALKDVMKEWTRTTSDILSLALLGFILVPMPVFIALRGSVIHGYNHIY